MLAQNNYFISQRERKKEPSNTECGIFKVGRNYISTPKGKMIDWSTATENFAPVI